MKPDIDNTLKWNTAKSDFYYISKEIKKYLKANQTYPEKLLWRELRNKKLGHKFRRQHIIDVFIVDFVCIKKKLVVEVDGKIHLRTKEYDKARTETLSENGFWVIRFTNEKVVEKLSWVLHVICANLAQQTPPNLPEGEE